MMHKYYFCSRPPGIGCQPDGDIIDEREVWMPARNFEWGHALGVASWEEPLSPRDIFHYSLRPVCEIERAWLTFYNRKKAEFNQWLYDNYMKQPLPELQQYAIMPYEGYKARAALLLLEAGYEGGKHTYGGQLIATKAERE